LLRYGVLWHFAEALEMANKLYILSAVVFFLLLPIAHATETLLYSIQAGPAYRDGRIQARIETGKFYRARSHPSDRRWYRILIANTPHEAEAKFFVTAESKRQELASAVNRAPSSQALVSAAAAYTRYYRAMLSHQGHTKAVIDQWERDYARAIAETAARLQREEQMQALEKRVRSAEAAARRAEDIAHDAWLKSTTAW
jgi:transglutaminase-like putative cysteine protease